MIFSGKNHILVVDDDQDVLAITKLALKNIEVYGVANQIHTATSKAQAIEVYNSLTTAADSSFIMTAFIDVIMETEYAGLELCQYIRETRRNQYSTLYVRTGQPGTAPERSVMDRYDINGYFSKVETTEDKLYSLLKAGVRQFYYNITATGLGQAMVGLAEAETRQNMQMVIAMLTSAWQSDASGEEVGADVLQFPFDFVIDGTPVLGTNPFDPAELDHLPSMRLADRNDKFVFDEQGRFLMKIGGTSSNAETLWYGYTYQAVPEIAQLWYGFNRVLSSLWKQRG